MSRILGTYQKWTRTLEIQGNDALRHKPQNKYWSPDDKLELVSKVLAGASIMSTALNAGINEGMLHQWVQKYKEFGYNGLVVKTKGRKSKVSKMKKKTTKPKELNESKREELIRLRAEIEYIKTENELIKKK